MSLLKSIKQQLGLGPAAENHFFDGSVPNQLTLKRGTPDQPGAELIKALNGVLSFPNQGTTASQNGFISLPNGILMAWGASTSDGAGNAAFGFNGQTFSGVPRVFCQLIGNGNNVGVTSVEAVTSTQATVRTTNGGTPGALTFGWFAIGASA